MECVLATLCRNSNVGNPRVLGAEVVRENIQLTDCLKGGLTGGRRAEYRVGGALAVDSKVRAVTLEAEKLEFAITYPLRDVRIQIQK